MKQTTLIGFVMLAVFLMAPRNFVWAQHGGHGASPMPARDIPKTGTVKGRTVEVDKTAITVKIDHKGMEHQETYQITDRTRIKGDPAAGTEVKVKYREEQGVRIATVIEVQRVSKSR